MSVAPHPLFVSVMRCPSGLQGLSDDALDQLLRYARRAGLFGNLVARAKAAGVEMPALNDLFLGGELFAAEHMRRIDWELHQLAPLLRQADFPVVVLKGGAYLLMQLPSAIGRLVADLDLLVPEDALARAESVMLSNGYLAQKQEHYDQQYYRNWMHELPPMYHPARGATVDLHHNIAPPVSRLKIDAGKLLERAVRLTPGLPYLRLSDEDMVLHLCIHMFHDGELHNALRELFDLDAVLRRFGDIGGFPERLMHRAVELGCVRPLYHGLHFAQVLLGTPVDAGLTRALARHAPARPWRWGLHALMRRALLPDQSERPALAKQLAEQFLFLRAHWLRMPPRMLLGHLLTQYRRRGGLKTAEQAIRNEAQHG